MFRAAWRHILEDSCEEKGNPRGGGGVAAAVEEARDALPGEEAEACSVEVVGVARPQHCGLGLAVESRSQWRLRKMGMSLKAQKRWILILELFSRALVSCAQDRINGEREERRTYEV